MSSEGAARGGDWVGRVLDGRYRVVEVLAKGGMATVYLAIDERLSRKVAVKVPHVELLATPGFRERFQEEIHSLTTLSHPNVVQIIDVGEVDGLPYAILQYIEAKDLEARRRESGRPETLEEVMGWLPQVAAALEFIHGQGLLHRDVKPGNIIVDVSGNVYLTDFGIVKALGERPSEFSTVGGRPGSPAYMGPEVVKVEVLGPAYDQYALGATLYVLLGGTLPWAGQSEVKALATKLSVDAPRLPATVPDGVDAAVRRAMARDEEARHPSCIALADAFADALESETGSAVPAPGGAVPADGPSEETRFTAVPPVPASGRARVEEAVGEAVEDDGATRLLSEARPGALPTEPPTAGPEPAIPTDDSATRFVSVTQRVRKRTSPLLLAGVAALVVVLAVVVVLQLRGGTERSVAVAAPTVKLTSPRPDSITNDARIRVRGTVNEAVQTVLVNGETAQITDDLTFAKNLALTEDGVHPIKVVATNADGKTAESFTRVTLDRVPPALTILQPGPDRSPATRISEFEIVGRIDDLNARVFYGEERLPLDEEGRFQVYEHLKEKGAHAFVLRAVDRAGNETMVTVDVVFDTTPPVLTLTEPEEGATVVTPAGRMRLSGVVDDPGSSVTVGGRPVSLDDEGAFSVKVPVAQDITEGEGFTIEIVALDAAGNESRQVQSLVRGPSLVVDEPANGAATSEESIWVGGTVSDIASPVMIGRESVRADAEGRFEYGFALGVDGEHEIRVSTVDSRDKAHECILLVYRDRTRPVIVVTSPEQWSDVDYTILTSDGADITLLGTLVDASPCVVTVNGTPGIVSDGRWTVVVRVAYGTDRLVLEVRDAAGNEAPPQVRPLDVAPPNVPGLRLLAPDEEGRLQYALEKDPTVVFLLIPAGEFVMGAVDGDGLATSVETPRRSVTVSRFVLSRAEITWRQFLTFVAETGLPFAEERRPAEEEMDHPVVGIRWAEAQAYCNWAGLRLPTEAEWEWAARGGRDDQVYPWGAEWDAGQANVRGHGEATALPGTSGAANAFGLHDVIGNAAEWCADWFAPDAYQAECVEPDPVGPETGEQRVVRGGSYRDGPEHARLSARRGLEPEAEQGLEGVGFRPAISAPVGP